MDLHQALLALASCTSGDQLRILGLHVPHVLRGSAPMIHNPAHGMCTAGAPQTAKRILHSEPRSVTPPLRPLFWVTWDAHTAPLQSFFSSHGRTILPVLPMAHTGDVAEKCARCLSPSEPSISPCSPYAVDIAIPTSATVTSPGERIATEISVGKHTSALMPHV